MISKLKEFSATFRNRLIYEFAARAQDFEKRKHVEFIGGNLISKNPYYEILDDGQRKVFVDVEPIISEFESYTSLYKGESTKLCGHYILSLSKGETLTSVEWMHSVKKYMADLGYDETTKFVAVVHRDTELEHVHIVSTRVRLVESDPLSSRASLGAHFELVSDSNDRLKGMDSARGIEQAYGLAVPVSDGWTKELPGKGNPDKDQAHIIRGISKEIFKASNRPSTMSQLIDRFAERGIQIRVRGNDGVVEGISYKLDRQDGRWISGSTIMSTKLTWQSLQRNGVGYLPSRDNAKLGLGMPTASPDAHSVRNDGALFRAYVKINKPNQRLKSYFNKHSRRTYLHYSDDRTNLFMGFNFGIAFNMRKKTRNEVEIEIEKERIAKLLASMFKLIQEVMDSLFRGMSVHFDFESYVSDYPQTALRLNAPVILNTSGQFDLDENWQESVIVQTRTQLSSLAKLCHESEKEAILELNA
ncbi:relaxase/mobilization nuclease domain-containing protein [Pseudomonas mandelii]|uniref:relaxase/mobilization nuclease domain-containing protein n=1 Tax=Pseudomonas mandelii TaxID=75612 RepID=UPI001C83281F|nr:relaxase/mobilization nuclease domain-containing protein [Pseudomonas mandelii]QZA96067.1 relaxase/mobilization nuclease domain-containing protein [Pseudomonas mandelii]